MIFSFPDEYFFDVESKKDFIIDCLGLQNNDKVKSLRDGDGALSIVQSSAAVEAENKIIHEIDNEYAEGETSE